MPAQRGVAARDAMAQLISERALMAVTNRHTLKPGRLQVARMSVELPLTPAAEKDIGKPTFTSEVQVIACGSLALVALPGEPLISLAKEIQSRSPFTHTLVLGYSNGNGVEYVGMPGDKTRGGYEMGEYGAGTDECGQLLIDRAVKLLKAVAHSSTSESESTDVVAGKAAANDGQMKVLSKEVFIRHQGPRAPCTGFVTYISDTRPTLMHCHGWEDFSDGYDDFSVSVSEDNGKTWSVEEMHWKSREVPEGRIRYAEPAALFDPGKKRLIVLTQQALYPEDKLDLDADYSLVLDIYDCQTKKWSDRRVLKFPGQRSPAMSFSFPIHTSHGRLLFPGMRQVVDASGKPVHYKNLRAPVDEAVNVIGQYGHADEINWHLSEPLKISPDVSSRGLNEHAVAELPDNRIAAVCRGDNSAFPQKPGYKWLSFSRDDGETWSEPVPLPATGGDPIESGANGSALFRSIKNGKLYWIGNLALNGERAKGNWPRSPLVIVEVQDEPVVLKRDTIFTVDKRDPTDSPRVQFSNFRFYQDRETGDLVLFLTRYGEQSAKEWNLANYYRYRVQMAGSPLRGNHR